MRGAGEVMRTRVAHDDDLAVDALFVARPGVGIHGRVLLHGGGEKPLLRSSGSHNFVKKECKKRPKTMTRDLQSIGAKSFTRSSKRTAQRGTRRSQGSDFVLVGVGHSNRAHIIALAAYVPLKLKMPI